MKVLFVVNRVQDWPFDIPGSSTTTARSYLTDPAYSNGIDGRIVNLCRCEHHQGRGYYVSLLAEARGDEALPDVKTIEDLQSATLAELVAGELEPLIQESLQQDAGGVFELDSYFGRDPAGLHPAMSQQLFALLKAPLLRAQFEHIGGRWRLTGIRALAAGDVAPDAHPFIAQAATDYVGGNRRVRATMSDTGQPALAILHQPGEPDSPSNGAALEKFAAAAKALRMRVEIIGARDIERLRDFDGLFIRDTTSVNHYTYEFSRRAAAHGLVVIDDPDSILKCTNKVYLNELMARHQIPVPKTLMVHPDNIDDIVPTLGLPCIVKQPDSAFSLGVGKMETERQLLSAVQELLAHSEFVIAQEFVPTAFDWRVGILDRRALFVCQYFMAPGHWQVIKRESARRVEGRTTALGVGEAPSLVVKTALRAANLIGDGFYGVDLKQVGDQCYLIEVNDNPNVDAGNEDQVLRDALYREVIGVFCRRIQERRTVLPK